MKRQSDRRRAEQGERRSVVARAIARSGGRCMANVRGAPTPCHGELVGHEIVKRSQLRGAHLIDDNVTAVCSGHNAWIEDHPDEAHDLGLMMHRWEWDQRHGGS